MNPLTHFLVSFNLLLILFYRFVGIGEIVLFSLLFGVLIDFDEIVSSMRNKPKYHLRTWVQEPFGFIVIGIPAGILFMFMLKPIYFLLVIIPYALHIILDYMTFHEAKPLTPFSKKITRTGFVKPSPATPCYNIKFKGRKGISENHILTGNILLAIILLAILL